MPQFLRTTIILVILDFPLPQMPDQDHLCCINCQMTSSKRRKYRELIHRMIRILLNSRVWTEHCNSGKGIIIVNKVCYSL